MNYLAYGLALSLICAANLQAQTPADTTLSRTIQDVEVWGKQTSGLSGGTIQRLYVNESPTGINVSAADAFRQLPSLITDIEGGVWFRGSSKAGIFIDNTPYGLMEEYNGDILIQLPALFFKRVELAGFPPIDLVPDGDAGTLNLSTVTDKAEEHSPLEVTLGAGLHNRYNAGASFLLTPGKFRIAGKFNYRKEYRSRQFDKSTETAQNRTVMNNNANARPDVWLADLSAAYALSEQQAFGVHALYHRMNYDRYGKINNQVYAPNGNLAKHVLRNRYNTQEQDAYAVEGWWSRTFDSGAALSARIHYNDFAYDEDNDYKNENPETGAIVAEDNQFIDHKKHNYYWSLRYFQSLHNNISLLAGYIGRATSESYTNQVNAKQGEIWQANPDQSYAYDFNRYLNLLYLSLEWETEHWEAEAGLQAEAAKRIMHETEKTSIRAFHLYPRAHVSYVLDKHQKFSLGYQQRVIRPLGSELNSYMNNSDATHIALGNPSLKDEYIHSAELSYQLTTGRFRFMPALFFRSRTNRIVEIAQQIDDQTVWQKQNSGTSRSFGADIAICWQPLQWLTLSASGEVYRDEIDGRTLGYDMTKSLCCWDVKGSGKIQLSPTTHLQIDGFYISDLLTAQGNIEGRYTVNAGLTQEFLHKKLCATLSLHNLFDSLGETTIIDTPTMQMKQVRNRDARVCWLTLTYRL